MPESAFVHGQILLPSEADTMNTLHLTVWIRPFRFPLASLCLLLIVGWLSPCPAADEPKPVAAVFLDQLPELDPEFAREVAALAEEAGFETRYIDAAVLTNAVRMGLARIDLLILPNARVLPGDSVAGVEAYLKTGGDLLAFGLPAWKESSFLAGDRWISPRDYDQALAAVRPAAIIAEFKSFDRRRWARSADPGGGRARIEFEDPGATPTLHVTVENLSSWDTVASPRLEHPFPPGHVLTCFTAWGGSNTSQLAVEWIEEDSSRWIATVDLTPSWKIHALPPEAFKPWLPPPGRGGPDDKLNVQKAVRFTVGLARSHTALDGARHEYWFGSLGTAPLPFGATVSPAIPNLPRLEAFSPDYLFWPLQERVGVLRLDPWTATPVPLGGGGGGRLYPLPRRDAIMIHPRPRGVGFAQSRPYRWQPLVVATSNDGDYFGAIGALVAHVQPPFKGGVWATFTPAGRPFYQDPPMRRLLTDTLQAIKRGVFLVEGGAESFTLFEGQSVRLGAAVMNGGFIARSNLTVRVTVSDSLGKRTFWSNDWTLALSPGGVSSVEESWKPVEWPAGGLRVQVELLQGGQAIDRLSHDLNVWRPNPKPEFIEARDGGLWLKGQAWKAHGVNYMPSSGIGQWRGDYFEHWIGRGAYDPEVIERDLQRVKAMGLNAVSAFIHHRSLDAQHLLDFLRRCDALGLRVNLSLRPGTPMDFRWNEMKDLIEFYRLAQNDTVFAYDLAWEPSHYDEAHQRRHYTTAWNDWVVKRHGTIEAAVKRWGVDAPRDGKLSSIPTMPELTEDGPWRKKVADYRLFLDDLLGPKYAEARRLVKSIDPHHPVSFRMQLSGDPTHVGRGLLPYDFHGLRDAVDLWEPEAYGRIGDWEKVKPGRFTADYARLCDPEKPVVWAEMGYSVWDANRMAPHPQKLTFASGYYRDFYRMLRESGADGVFFWWYPGGYRVNENSDYGIINPDGTERGITRVIREEGPVFLAAPKPSKPDCWIAVDRDRDARGLNGIYEAVKDEYWKAIEQGRVPGLKWSRKPGGSSGGP